MALGNIQFLALGVVMNNGSPEEENDEKSYITTAEAEINVHNLYKHVDPDISKRISASGDLLVMPSSNQKGCLLDHIHSKNKLINALNLRKSSVFV